jgi:2-polyprenyl-3-methyl-5-hydroxy-6-metoxy-1,4-benzoquinol methylase
MAAEPSEPSPLSVAEDPSGIAPEETTHYTLPRIRQAFDAIHTAPDVRAPSRFPRLAKRYRQLLYKILTHHDERANQQMTSLVNAIQGVADESSRSAGRLEESLDRVIRQLAGWRDAHDELVQTFRGLEVRQAFESRRLQNVASDVSQLSHELTDMAAHLNEVDRRVAGIGPMVADVEHRLSDVITPKVLQIEAEMIARPYTSEPNAGTFVDEDGYRSMGYGQDTGASATYADFADIYRGTEDLIATLLKPYTPLLASRAPVLDIGSGRGELLGILHSLGVAASGVDSDESMVQRCREKGLDVTLGDGLTTLEGAPPGSWGAITAIQVLEHMDVDQIVRFFSAAQIALRDGGLLLAETVNPHSPPALKAFWLDMTHVRPLYPEAMLALAQTSGFESARIIFPNGTGDLDTDLRQSGSYAIAAFKGSPPVGS